MVLKFVKFRGSLRFNTHILRHFTTFVRVTTQSYILPHPDYPQGGRNCLETWSEGQWMVVFQLYLKALHSLFLSFYWSHTAFGHCGHDYRRTLKMQVLRGNASVAQLLARWTINREIESLNPNDDNNECHQEAKRLKPSLYQFYQLHRNETSS